MSGSDTAQAADLPPLADPFPFLLLVLLSAVPLLVAAALLQLLGPLGRPLSDAELHTLRAALSAEPFLPGAMTLIAVLAVHVCVCLAGIAFAWFILRKVYRSRRVPGAMAGVGLATGILMCLIASSDIAVFRLTYYEFIHLYEGTGAAGSLLEPRIGNLNALTMAILLPVGLGIIGIAMITAAALSQISRVGPMPATVPSDAYEARLQLANAGVKRCLYLLSLGLVTSTVAASLFFHLPGKLSGKQLEGAPSTISARFDPANLKAVEALLEEAEAAGKLAGLQKAELTAVRGKFDAFAGELSVYWGAVFTLTLVAAAGIPVVVLQQKIRNYVENPNVPTVGLEAQNRLEKAGLVTEWSDQAKLLLAVVAPLATSSIANLVQKIG